MRRYFSIGISGLISAAALAIVTACQEPTACTADLRPSIVIDIRDSVTGANVVDSTTAVAHLRATSNGPVETTDSATFIVSPWSFFGAKGVWDVTLLHARYAPWSKSNIVVASTNGACPQPETVNLTARLVPAR